MVWWRDYSNPPDRGSGPVSAYVVYYRRRRERDWEALRQTRLKMAAVTGLQQDTDYEFQVAAVHQSGIVGIPSPILRVSTCGSKYHTLSLLLTDFSANQLFLLFPSPTTDEIMF